MTDDRHAKELKLLQTISETVDRTIDLRTVVEPILGALAENLGFEKSIITLLAKDSSDIWIEASRGLTKAQTALGHYKLGEGVIGRVVKSGEPLIVPRTADSPVFLNRTGSGRDADTAFLCVPIKEHEEMLGSLSVYRPSAPNEQLQDDVRLLAIVASMLARALLLRRDLQAQQDTLREENRQLRAELTRHFHPSNLVGNSHEMQLVYDQVAQVAPSNATVLVLGETGTGKELIARAVHAASKRADGPFVAVHCAALPESLIESELFGHLKGAFTGAAADRKGRFELADGGTIFLDEIGEIPLPIQAKLLRVIQERAFVPLGGEKPVRVDVRIVAATHRDLKKMVDDRLFREDLYYRLNVFPIYLPPLAKRKADILLLADHFLAKYAKDAGRPVAKLSPEAAELLMRYPWPGNVRELENCMERALLLAMGDVITADNLPATLRQAAPGSDLRALSLVSRGPGTLESRSLGTLEPQRLPVWHEGDALEDLVGAYEKEILSQALAAHGGRIAAAARSLRSTPRIVGYKAKKYGLTANKE